MSRSFYVLTGATSGMGLHTAQTLCRLPRAHIIAGVRSPERAKELRKKVPAEKLTILPLDLDKSVSVTAFAEKVNNLISQPDELSAIICVAGLQLIGNKQMSSPHIERTFQVNFLSHFLLVELLGKYLKPGGSIITVGSGTHNPQDKLASRFGFRGGIFPDARAVAEGELGQTGNNAQLGMDRYATSKLCAILYARYMAREADSRNVNYFCFDPGLMPGTHLARQRSAIEKFGWYYIMPYARHILSGVSTGKQSGSELVRLCISEKSHTSGSYIEFTGKLAPCTDVSKNDDKGRELIEYSRALISDYLQ